MNNETINSDLTISGESARALLMKRYRILRQLGQGGMGSVWLAEDILLDGKLFAIKMLPSILVSNKRAYNQLKAEALVSMKLVHQNIVALRAFEENGNNPFLVMDYIEGETLDDWLEERGTTNGRAGARADRSREPGAREDEIIRLLRPVAEALDYAHKEGVVHRDVKPSNVIIRKDGHPFILDFGIAREIQETMTRVAIEDNSGSPAAVQEDPPRPEEPLACQPHLHLTPSEPAAAETEAPEPDEKGKSEKRETTEEAPEPENPEKIPEENDDSPGEPVQEPHPPIISAPDEPDAPAPSIPSPPEVITPQGPSENDVAEIANSSEKYRETLAGIENSEGFGQDKKSFDEMFNEKYAGQAWLAANGDMSRAEQSFKERKFDGANGDFVKAEEKYIEAAKKSKNVKEFLNGLEREGFILDEKNNPRPAGSRGVLPLRNGSHIEMVWCPPGFFMMGSISNRDASEMRHPVHITKGFWISKYEVTQDQWAAVKGGGWGGRKPQTDVTVEDCNWFCRQFPAKYGVSLPSEAQWEYACRAGTQTEYSLGKLSNGRKIDGNKANVNAFWGVKDVGSFENYANHWGICDMHGNVREWCADIYKLYDTTEVIAADPLAVDKGYNGRHVVRGGHCREDEERCTCASRSAGKVDKYTGFRICCSSLP